MIGNLQVNPPPQKFPDKNGEKHINMKRHMSLQSVTVYQNYQQM